MVAFFITDFFFLSRGTGCFIARRRKHTNKQNSLVEPKDIRAVFLLNFEVTPAGKNPVIGEVFLPFC